MQSVYTCMDASGRSHDILQGEGGEGDSLMPVFFHGPFCKHPGATGTNQTHDQPPNHAS